MTPNTLEDIPAAKFCNKAVRPSLKQYPMLALVSMLTSGSIVVAADKDIAAIAEEKLALLENAVPKTNEDLLKKELKEQSEVFIGLELENQVLKDQIRELQQDITNIRTKNSVTTPANTQKSIQLLMEKQNQINALEKQIKEFQSTGNLIPTKIQQPENNSQAKLLQEENEKLMARLDQKEEEYFRLEKQIEKLNAHYEKQYIDKLNTPQVLPPAKMPTRRPHASISIFDEQSRPNAQNTKKDEIVTPSPKKVNPSNASQSKPDKFDSLLNETPPPLQHIEPIENIESSTPVKFDLIKNTLVKVASPKSVAKAIPIKDVKTNIAVVKQTIPPSVGIIEPTKPNFDLLKSTPSTPASLEPTKPNFDLLKNSSGKTESLRTNSNQESTPGKIITSNPTSPKPRNEAPENPVIATEFQLWDSDMEYESLLPPRQPAPSTGIDLLGRRLGKSSMPDGLDGYDIPGIDAPSLDKETAQKPSIPPTSAAPILNQLDSGILESLQSQEIIKDQPPTVGGAAIQKIEEKTDPAVNSEKKKHTNPNSGTLVIEANVEELSGSVKPAYHTEFFITTQDLTDILSMQPLLKEEIDREITGKNISSYAELWARAQKYGYNYPGLAAKIRKAIKEAGAHRIRTDANGQAKIKLKGEDQLKGERYIVGVSPLGTVGVVWSKQFYIQDYAPENKTLRLEIKDAIWLQ
ncbi:MAG: hypothetical protein HN467_07695 [Opitutae bacterium]|nr:hypothetical protein [Opitutae bacterium]